MIDLKLSNGTKLEGFVERINDNKVFGSAIDILSNSFWRG